MENTDKAHDPSYNNPNNPSANDAPPDPSNTTSNVGLKVEQGVISKHKGISEQSAEWEDMQESNPPTESSLISEDAEKYIKDPSPEEVSHNESTSDSK